MIVNLLKPNNWIVNKWKKLTWRLIYHLLLSMMKSIIIFIIIIVKII